MPRSNSSKQNKRQLSKKNSSEKAKIRRAAAATPGRAGGGRATLRGQSARGKVPEEAARLKKVEKQIKELEKERAELRPKVAAMQPPELQLPEAGIKRNRGSQYSTWFKAQGSFGNRADWDSYSQMAGLLDDMEMDFDAPAAFYSNAVMGRVKFPGIVDREVLISQLNDIAGWNGDFRDIYPRWEYTYRIVESIGGVPIQFFTHKAKQPLSKKDRARGWKPF